MTMMYQFWKATESAILFTYVATVFVLGSWDLEIAFWSETWEKTSCKSTWLG